MMAFHLLISEWYRQNKRELPWRNTRDPYLIWLSEIILQQTRVNQGLSYFNKFVKHYPTIWELSNATERQVLNDWQGLGYYSRARNLHQTAKSICENNDGCFPNDYNAIIKLKGIGPYTAAAIASFAFNKKHAVVDGNVFRVLSRVFNIKTPIDSTKGKHEYQSLANQLIPDKEPGIFNQAIMELGALICTPLTPKCSECPLKNKCLAKDLKNTHLRPVKSKKTKVTNRYFHYLVYEEQGKTIVQQRLSKDIWQNLYQFPLIETETERFPDFSNLTPAPYKSSPGVKHSLSHQKIHVVFHHINFINQNIGPDYIMIEQKDIQDYPLPRVIDKYLDSSPFKF